MKLEDFHVQPASWAREADRVALLGVREEVFIREQGVPVAREHDALDADAWHLLARDRNGTPIGCARLTAAHLIGRMAVLPAWRGHGVGRALLREAIARARALGWQEVGLHAQAAAIGFYAGAGFTAYGERFMDAGIEHQAMRLELAAADTAPVPVAAAGRLPVTGPGELAAARRQLLADTRRQLALRLPQLAPEAWASDAELEALRRIATSGPGACIRILLHDPEAALRIDHRLIPLAQRLSSAFEIRVPVDDVDLAWPSAVLLNDVGGYLFLPDASRPQGRAARRQRALQAPLQQAFDRVWERSVVARVLQKLDL